MHEREKETQLIFVIKSKIQSSKCFKDSITVFEMQY